MSPKQQFNQLERLDQWIRRRGTGTLDCIARRLGISKRSVSNRLDTLKTLGAEIKYDSSRSSYYYTEAFDFRKAWLGQF